MVPHSRVNKPTAELCSNFGDSAITKGQIAYFSLRMRETAIFLLSVKHLTTPSCTSIGIYYKMQEFWRFALSKAQIAYCSLCMRKTAICLLPVKNLTSRSCSPTPISYMMQKFWRFGHKYGPNCIFFYCACTKRPYFYFLSKI